MSLANRSKRVLRIIRRAVGADDLRVTTWLALGAALQILCSFCFPSTFSIILPLLLLSYRLASAIIQSRQIFSGCMKHVKRGRWTVPLVASLDRNGETSAPEGVTMFILGARINNPLGRAASGAFEVHLLFEKMWKEAAEKRVEFGYLGHTRSMVDCFDENEGQTFIWLSYWRDPEGLQKFAASATHRLTAAKYDGGKWPTFGIMHETYYSKKDGYETIYDNFPAFGMGDTKIVVGKTADGVELESPLRPAKTSEINSMFGRMGRKRSPQ